ncbi:rho guanine nucleotide exchange factor 10-like protein [Trichonephila clavata]|uniref:Rho guanine nucleotide exchange factor 10-like protein n=1 Tax=Trichonephila clavata TaxID=2740835 RepID=A0A8X6KLZ9_TRICU|nr:rho guanine nucleotide exchange factor 10-like protein [Trichonephila clavata]
MGGVDLGDHMANVSELDRKPFKCLKKVFSHFFIVPLAEALVTSRKLNAPYQRHRGTGHPSKISRSLLNVGGHLPVTTKTRRWCRKCV